MICLKGVGHKYMTSCSICIVCTYTASTPATSQFFFSVDMGGRTCSLRASLLAAALSAVSLLVLITMVLSVLMASGALRGLSVCSTCASSADSAAASSLVEYIEVLRADMANSIQLLNTSFQSLSLESVDQGEVGSRGYNGSVGEEGPVGEPSPMATHGNISLDRHCRNVLEQCTLNSSLRTCSTPAVLQTGSYLTHHCLLRPGMSNTSAVLVSYVNGSGTFLYCRCDDAAVSQGSSTLCQHSSVVCDWSSVNVTVTYP